MVELEAAYASYGQLLESYEAAEGEIRGVQESAMTHSSQAAAYLVEIKDLVATLLSE